MWFESLPNVLCLFVFSVPPLFVIEFLHRVVDTFTEYFSSCTETSIKDNVVIVFEVRKKGKELVSIYYECSCYRSNMYLVKLVFLLMKEIIIIKIKNNYRWSHLVDLP